MAKMHSEQWSILCHGDYSFKESLSDSESPAAVGECGPIEISSLSVWPINTTLVNSRSCSSLTLCNSPSCAEEAGSTVNQAMRSPTRKRPRRGETRGACPREVSKLQDLLSPKFEVRTAKRARMPPGAYALSVLAGSVCVVQGENLVTPHRPAKHTKQGKPAPALTAAEGNAITSVAAVARNSVEKKQSPRKKRCSQIVSPLDFSLLPDESCLSSRDESFVAERPLKRITRSSTLPLPTTADRPTTLHAFSRQTSSNASSISYEFPPPLTVRPVLRRSLVETPPPLPTQEACEQTAVEGALAPASAETSSPIDVDDGLSDEDLFILARKRGLEVAKERIKQELEEWDPRRVDRSPRPPRVHFGDHIYITQYPSLHPAKIRRLPCLFLCEFCLAALDTVDGLKSHYETCAWHRPPGTLVYQDDVNIINRVRRLLVYQIDGTDWPLYCANLCLFAKLFIEDKLLVHDVYFFLFYIVCYRDECGDHLMGYFSRDKARTPDPHNRLWNLNCVMVLPAYQTILFSSSGYLLSRQNKEMGTPERPLSSLGQRAYKSCWRNLLLDFLTTCRENGTIQTLKWSDIAQNTGMWLGDVTRMLTELKIMIWTGVPDSGLEKEVKEPYLDSDAQILMEWRNDCSNKRRIALKPEKWIPSETVNFTVNPPSN